MLLNELKMIGFVVIEGINHFIFSRGEIDGMYLINGITGSVVRIDRVDEVYRPVPMPSVVEKAISLLETRLEIADKINKHDATYSVKDVEFINDKNAMCEHND